MDSDLHKKLKNFLSARLSGKVDNIQRNLEVELNDIPALKNYGGRPVTVTLQGRKGNNILVKIELDFGLPKNDSHNLPVSPSGDEVDYPGQSLEDFAREIENEEKHRELEDIES